MANEVMGRKRPGRLTMVAGLLAALLTAGLAGPAWARMCMDCPDGHGDGGGGGGGAAQPMPPQVAIQVRPCIANPLPGGGDLQAQMAQSVTGAVNGGFRQLRRKLGVKNSVLAEAQRKDREPYLNPSLWPSPDVRVACVDGRTTIAVWFEQAGTYGPADTDAERTQQQQEIDLLPAAADNFGMKVSKDGMMVFLNIVLDHTWQTRLKGTPVRLRGWDISFQQVYPHTGKVGTRIDGYVQGQVTGETTDFWIVIGDTLSVPTVKPPMGLRAISCDGDAAFDHGSSIDTILLDIVSGVFGEILRSYGVDLPDLDAADPTAALGEGPGCGAAQMFPEEIVLPGSVCGQISCLAWKQVFDYRRLYVGGGVGATGRTDTVLRVPSAYIAGPSVVYVQPGQPAQARFSVTTRDMRKPYQQVAWTAPGASISNPSVGSPEFTWSVSFGASDTVSRTVRVTVRDSDGLVASWQRTVLLRSAVDQDEPDPPQCHTKPWLCDPDW